MMVSIFAISFDAMASEGSASIDVKKLNANLPHLSASISSSNQYTYNNQTFYSDGLELYDVVREGLDKTDTMINIKYYTARPFRSIRELQSKLVEIIAYGWSDDISKTSTDGDYAHWSVDDLDYEYSNPKTGYYDIDLEVGYYNTEEQEKAVDEIVDKIVKDIRAKDWSDYQTIKYIHDYICNSTTYNNAAIRFPERYPTAFSAYGALIGGKVVCQGYSVAFYRICKELGFDVRFVYSNDKGNHAWNMIRMDDKTYFVDCTWDDNIMDDSYYDTDPLIQGNGYYYFLVDYETLRSEDDPSVRIDYTHLLDEELTDDDSFVSKYMNRLADKDYDPNDTHLTMCKEKLEYSSTAYSASAKMPALIITDVDGDVLEEGIDYIATYSSNITCGRAVVNINGMGEYKGMNSHRTFVIKPKKMSKPSLVDGGRTKSSLNIKWTNPGGSADGYQLQQYVDGAWKTVKTFTNTSTLTYKLTSLSACKKYEFRIRAYKIIGKVKYYGDYSTTYTTYTSPSTPSITLSTKSRSITAKWKKVSCTGYEIQYSTDKDMKNAKTVKASSTATSKTIKSLKRGKRYYVRVRAYKTATVGSTTNTYRSPWSTKKSITVK